ncbi:MAG: hypothetical protein S4CHLAM7_13150 [Chlamydiae bacterium]|nr:hypothetical protein [Chlamydiota bacterium]
MTKKVSLKNEKRVSVCLSKEQLLKVERMAIEMSRQEGKLITVSEAIRRSVEICYPIAEQGCFLS